MHELLLKALISANIPFSVVENADIRALFARLGFCLKSRTFYSSKLLDQTYESYKNDLKQKIIGQQVGLKFDESLDRSNRKILTVQLFLIKKSKSCKSFTIWTGETENTTSDMIVTLIKAALDRYYTTYEEKN